MTNIQLFNTEYSDIKECIFQKIYGTNWQTLNIKNYRNYCKDTRTIIIAKKKLCWSDCRIFCNLEGTGDADNTVITLVYQNQLPWCQHHYSLPLWSYMKHFVQAFISMSKNLQLCWSTQHIDIDHNSQTTHSANKT